MTSTPSPLLSAGVVALPIRAVTPVIASSVVVAPARVCCWK